MAAMTTTMSVSKCASLNKSCVAPSKRSIVSKPSLATSKSATVRVSRRNAAAFRVRAEVNRMYGEKSVEELITESKDARLEHLAEQSKKALKIAVESFDKPVFPNAMIAGDCVITALLGELGYLTDGTVKVMVVDTFHLFPETMEFLKKLEEHYNFKAEVFQADGCADKSEYDTKHGADLWKENIEEYDRICKVEPFGRGLKETGCNCMINGRTRWQGFERAYIDLYEASAAVGGMAKVNPLAYWTFEDTFDYIAKYKIPAHPLHADGYPSLGDAKDTIPIPEDGSTKFVDFEFVGDKTAWLDYASERKGRFVNLVNKDGSKKTECGIHVAGAEKTWDRDLWESGSVKAIGSNEDALALKKADAKSLMVVYAPWCQFCQKMEDEFEALAAEMAAEGVTVAKFRGDEVRDFVTEEFNVASFPTINLVGGGSAIKYESEERDVASMKAFLKA